PRHGAHRRTRVPADRGRARAGVERDRAGDLQPGLRVHPVRVRHGPGLAAGGRGPAGLARAGAGGPARTGGALVPLFAPFRRATAGERVVQAGAWVVAGLAAAVSLGPFVLLVAGSFGDVTDWWAKKPWPDLSWAFRTGRREAAFYALKYEYWTW